MSTQRSQVNSQIPGVTFTTAREGSKIVFIPSATRRVSPWIRMDSIYRNAMLMYRPGEWPSTAAGPNNSSVSRVGSFDPRTCKIGEGEVEYLLADDGHPVMEEGASPTTKDVGGLDNGGSRERVESLIDIKTSCGAKDKNQEGDLEHVPENQPNTLDDSVRNTKINKENELLATKLPPSRLPETALIPSPELLTPCQQRAWEKVQKWRLLLPESFPEEENPAPPYSQSSEEIRNQIFPIPTSLLPVETKNIATPLPPLRRKPKPLAIIERPKRLFIVEKPAGRNGKGDGAGASSEACLDVKGETSVSKGDANKAAIESNPQEVLGNGKNTTRLDVEGTRKPTQRKVDYADGKVSKEASGATRRSSRFTEKKSKDVSQGRTPPKAGPSEQAGHQVTHATGLVKRKTIRKPIVKAVAGSNSDSVAAEPSESLPVKESDTAPNPDRKTRKRVYGRPSNALDEVTEAKKARSKE